MEPSPWTNFPDHELLVERYIGVPEPRWHLRVRRHRLQHGRWFAQLRVYWWHRALCVATSLAYPTLLPVNADWDITADAGATPQAGGNSFSAGTNIARDYESDIWDIDPTTNEVTAHWVNTDGSTCFSLAVGSSQSDNGCCC